MACLLQLSSLRGPSTPQTSLKPFRVRGLKVSTLQASTAWGQNFQKRIYAFKGLVYQGFQGFQGNQKSFSAIPHTNAPDGAYHVPMRFSQVVKDSRAGHRTSHTSMSTLSKTLQSSKSAPQGPEFFQPVLSRRLSS